MMRVATRLLLTGLLFALGLVLMGGAIAQSPEDSGEESPKPTARRTRPSRAAPSVAPEPAAVPAGKIELEILHTNDLHGHLRPGVGNRGGAGAIASIVEKARLRARTDAQYDALVVDAGDIFGGTAEDFMSHGKMMADFLLGAGYDVLTVGNHDFGHGRQILHDVVASLKARKMAVLGANIRLKGGAQATQIADGAVLVEKKGIKIGIVGATTPGVERMNLDANVEGLEFPDPIEVLKEKVAQLKQSGATIIILVSHVGHDNGKYVDDQKIAAAIPEIRVIVGGHSHTALKHAQVQENGALIVQTGANGRALGSLKIWFDQKTKKPADDDRDNAVDHSYTLIDLKTVTGAHTLVDELRAKYWAPVQAQLDAQVGIASETLYRKFYKIETQLGDLLADAVLEAAPGAQIAIVGNSDLRADLFKGPLQYKDIFAVVPFENSVVKLTVTGKLLKEVMDDCYDSGRHFAQVAGMRVTVDSRKPAGQRIESIRIGDQLVADDGQYVLATTDFIAQGKGGFSQFARPTFESTGITIRDALIARIKKLGTLTDAGIPMGRLRDVHLSEEIGRVTTTFSTDMWLPGPNLFDVVAHSVLGSPARGDLALIDSREIKWRLSEKFPIVRRDLNELVSYDRNELATAMITGKQLKEVFASLLKKSEGGREKRFKGYIAGGQLIINGSQVELLIGGKPVEDAKSYKLVSYDHLLSGPRGFEVLGKMNLKQTKLGIKMRDGLEQWIKQTTPIGPEDFPAQPAIVMEQAVARTAARIANFSEGESEPREPAEPQEPKPKKKTKKAGHKANPVDAAPGVEVDEDEECDEGDSCPGH